MALKYRSDIDGLRAIAVLAVIFFHAGISGFSGGFVGVDIFFVISGFLITSIILKDIQAGNFSVARFYERRIRRIFPALFPVIVFTLIIGAFLLDAIAFKAFGKSITATTLFASNILFWRESGYFDAASTTKPLLHTWSLAVEEQFYIFFPLLLVAIHRFLKSRYLPLLLGATVISLVASIYGVYTIPSATFYLVPTRAWELLFGSLLALGVIPLIQSHVYRNLLSITGIGLIIYSVAFYTEKTFFPGANALSPVLGASLIIYSGLGGGAFINDLLSFKPVVYIGLISYSLYLWHWPLFAFAKYLLFRELTPWEVVGIILLTVIISSISYSFIEKPFRGNQPIIANRKKLFVLSAVVIFIASSVGGIIAIKNGMPSRHPKENEVIVKATNTPFWDEVQGYEKIVLQINQNKTLPVIGTTNVTPSFLLWGDSHAEALIPAFSYQAKQSRLSGFIATYGGSPPLLGINRNPTPSWHINILDVNNGVAEFIEIHPELKTVILTANWGGYIDKIKSAGNGEDAHLKDIALFKAGLTRTVRALLAMNRHVVLVSDVPNLDFDVVKDYYFSGIFGDTYTSILTPTIREHYEKNRKVNDVLNELSHLSGVTLISPEPLLFDKRTGRVKIIENNNLLYRDEGHLSGDGALLISAAFNDLFRQMAHSK